MDIGGGWKHGARLALLVAIAMSCHGGSVAAVAGQPSNREAAVAIDRITVPPSDTISLDALASGLRLPWSLAFLPGGGSLVVEKHDGLGIVRSNGVVTPLLPGGPPLVFTKADSGHLDVALDPDFSDNGLIYLAFVEGTQEANRTAIWKAQLAGERLVDGEVIFRANVEKKGPGHPGGRLLFLPDKTLLLTVGDGYDYRTAAQDMRSHLGKVLRLTREGRAAPGNPFVGKAGAAPEIWTSGHRNIQGLTRDIDTGEIWAHEHGPRGGDEINRLKPGANYGWPTVSHGIDYDGTLITDRIAAPGIEPASFFWAPSITPSGFILYRGSRYPGWAGKLFVGGLASRSLVRLRVGSDTRLLVEEERMLVGLRERIRDVRQGPDGLIYLLTDEEKGRLLRLVPAPAPR